MLIIIISHFPSSNLYFPVIIIITKIFSPCIFKLQSDIFPSSIHNLYFPVTIKLIFFLHLFTIKFWIMVLCLFTIYIFQLQSDIFPSSIHNSYFPIINYQFSNLYFPLNIIFQLQSDILPRHLRHTDGLHGFLLRQDG